VQIEITRLVDGKKLPELPLSRFQVNHETFGSSRSQSSAIGLNGETVPLSSNLDQKSFSITWFSSDTTGYEQRLIRMFFSSPEGYEINCEEFGLFNVWGYPYDTQLGGFAKTTVSFDSRYGTDLWLRYDFGGSRDYYAGDDPSYSGGTRFFLYNSEYGKDGIIQITLSAPESTIWYPGTKVKLQANIMNLDNYEETPVIIDFTIGAQDNFGRWNLTQKRKSILVDSTRLVLGSGYFDPNTFKEFVLPVGHVADGQVDITTPTGEVATSDWSVLIEFVSPIIEEY